MGNQQKILIGKESFKKNCNILNFLFLKFQ